MRGSIQIFRTIQLIRVDSLVVYRGGRICLEDDVVLHFSLLRLKSTSSLLVITNIVSRCSHANNRVSTACFPYKAESSWTEMPRTCRSSDTSGPVFSVGNNTGKVVTAPSAAESRQILQRLALQPAASRSLETFVLPPTSPNGARVTQSPSPTNSKAADGGARSHRATGKPVIISDQDTRTQLREMRSPPRGKRIVDVTMQPGAGIIDSSQGMRDLRTWNPASIDDPVERQRAPLAVVGSGVNGSSNMGSGREGGELTSVNEAYKQRASIARYWAMVEARVEEGSLNALGAGARSPLVELPLVRDACVFCGGVGEVLCMNM